ncbi:MAG: ATP synthase subunit I [Oscillospiraceae bacterium]|nr:ATP synthase subunit I [Oscillospiraceae bacterium]MBQ7130727.1 ATP synthase subunit I [Oscillospiraceae bacterium]
MKLQPASKKEIKRIATGVAVCDVLMIAALFVLSLLGVGTFNYRVFVGALGGSVIAVVNFTVMCLTIQKATNIEEKKQMKAFIQGSYNGRLLLQAGWVVVCFLVSHIHLLAGAAPLLFPNLVIYYLNARGKLMPPDPPRDPSKVIADEDEDEALGPFEI